MPELVAVLVVALLVLIVALIALILALETRSRLRWLEQRLEALEGAPVRQPAAARTAAPIPPPVPVQPATTAPPASVEVGQPPQPLPPMPAPLPPAGEAVAPTAVRPAAAPEAATPVKPAQASPSLEERIGITWFTRIGAAVLVLGAAYFFKYAVDNQWIGPWGRVALGALAGVAVLLGAEWMRPKARPAYVQGLLGVGLALLYVSGYAAYGFYGLLPLSAAFAALVVVAALAAGLSIRHRSQLVLVLALAAALANPLLLSTGQERPLGFFSYLLAVTSAVLVVAVRQRFPIATWLAVAGTGALAIIWFGEHFRIDPPATDPLDGRPVPDTAGAYFPLAARIVPLTFAAAFAAQWVVTALGARRRAWTAPQPVLLLVVGLLLAHVGSGALLPDRPELLAIAMAVCALAAVLLLRSEQETPLVMLPLMLSFVILAARADLARSQPALTLVPAAIWLGVYATAMVRRAQAVAEKRPTAPFAAALTLTLLAAVTVAALVLLPGHPQTLVALLCLLAAGAALLGQWTGRPLVLGVGAAATFVALLAANPEGASMAPGFLLLAAVWGAVYLLGGAHALLVRGLPADPATVLVTVGGPLGFVAVLLAGTARGDSGERALAAAGAGLAVFVLGTLVLRRRADARPAATAFLGCGVGLVALAVGLALSGVTITLVWALMGVAGVFLAVRNGDGRWLAGGLALLAIAVLRMLVVDVVEPARMLGLFIGTKGAKGALQPTFLLNPRALALAGVAAALLASAWLLSRAHRTPAWASLAVLVYALLLALVISEVRLLVTALPAFPGPGLAPQEFEAFMARVEAAAAAQAPWRAVSVTLALGGFGSLLLAAGFASRNAVHRWLGLVVLAFTVGKLGLWDVWDLPRIYQVLVLVAVGALLLGAGFLYARFGNRMLGLLRNGAAGLLVVTAAVSIEAAEPARYRLAARLDVPAAGAARLEVSPELYRAAASRPRLADLRILSGDGREVPWFLRDVAPREVAAELPAEMVDPVTLGDGSARATFDLGPGGARHSELDLDLAGDTFLRLATVEVGEDGRSWGTIGQGHVYAVSTPAGSARSTTLRYAVSAARFVRVTVAGAAGQEPVGVRGGRVRHRPPAAMEPCGELELSIVSREPDRVRRHTLVVADAGSSGVPLRALTLEVIEPRFERQVHLETASRAGLWSPAGCGLLFRAGDESQLRLPLATDKRFVRMAIRDGDDAPLTVRAVRGEYRRQEVVLETPSAGPLEVLVGREDDRAPEYDLAAFAARVHELALAPATLGPLASNPRFAPSTDSSPRPWTERHRVVLGVLLGLLALAQAWWAYTLVRASA